MRRRMPWLVAALLLSAPAAADDDPPPGTLEPVARKKVADRLFEEAHAALEADDWDTGCRKFTQSMRYDTSVSTLLNIARCHEHGGQLLEAWRAYNRARLLNRDTEDEARRASLATYLEEAAAGVEARLARLRVVVTNAPAGLAIASDGVAWTEGLAGELQPLDPGEHVIVVSAPGFRAVERTVTLEEGGTDELVVTLEAAPDEPVVAPPAPPVPSPAAPTTSPAPPVSPPDVSPPVWVWPVGGAGLALVGVGVGLGVRAGLARSELASDCTDLGDGFGCPDDRYTQDDVDALQSGANFLVPGVAVGVAGLGLVTAAIVGFVLTPGDDEVALRVGPTGASLSVRF